MGVGRCGERRPHQTVCWALSHGTLCLYWALLLLIFIRLGQSHSEHESRQPPGANTSQRTYRLPLLCQANFYWQIDRKCMMRTLDSSMATKFHSVRYMLRRTSSSQIHIETDHVYADRGFVGFEVVGHESHVIAFNCLRHDTSYLVGMPSISGPLELCCYLLRLYCDQHGYRLLLLHAPPTLSRLCLRPRAPPFADEHARSHTLLLQ